MTTVGVRRPSATGETVRARIVTRLPRRAALPALKDLPGISAVLSILVGSVVLVGWWLEIDGLKSLVPGLLTMKVNTALAFVLLGLGLLARSRPVGTLWHRLGIAPLIGMMLLTAAVGSQYLSGQTSGIDQWLFRELPGQIATVHPNRMSPMTVLCFLSIGTAVLLASRNSGSRLVPTLLLGALIVASLNILDVIFAPTAPTVLASYSQMALNTAVTIFVLSIGTMGLIPCGGPLEAFLGPTTSASLARRLLVASLVAPLVFAWLRLEGEGRGLYGTRYGASLMVLATIFLLAAVIWQTTRSARRVGAAQLAAREERDRFFDVSSDLLATARADGYFVRLNPAWKATLGYELEELMSRPFVDFVHPDDRLATTVETGLVANEGRTTLNFQNRYRHRDGSYRWLEWTATPSADGSHMYAAARDVTIRKHEEECLQAPILAARARQAEALQAIEATIGARTFRPVFQPVVDLSSGLVVGFEALTRFDDGGRPDLKFAAAIECGLGIELETVTLEAALRESAVLPANAWLSLNVSPALLTEVQILQRVLRETSRSIILEVTEHEAIGSYAECRQAVARLGPNVRLAVDDAGAGIANFSHLVELRPQFVKIDAGLVRGVDTDAGRAAVIVGLTHFSAAAGCSVIAEGIETEAERATLATLGAGLGQGYLLGRPAAAETWKRTPCPRKSATASSGRDRRLRIATARRLA